MSIPRSQLITGVTNDPFVNGESTIPTSLALSGITSAKNLDANIDLNSITSNGFYRYNETTTNLPMHLNGTSGFLFVIHEAKTITDGVFGSSTTTTSTATKFRQVVWADGATFPYTRTKENSGDWTNWFAATGTNPVVIIDKNMTAIPETTYYSYEDHILTLPALKDVAIGTTIVLNQYAGTTTVTDDTSSYAQELPSLIGTTKNVWSENSEGFTRGDAISHTIGAQSYIIKVVEDNTTSTGKRWDSIAKNGLEQTIENHEQRFDSKEKKRHGVTIGRDVISLTTTCTGLYGNAVTLKELYETTNPIITITTPSAYRPQVNDTLYKNNIAYTYNGTGWVNGDDTYFPENGDTLNKTIDGVAVTYTFNGSSWISDNQTLILPDPTEDYLGSKITVVLIYNLQAVIIKTVDSAYAEKFINNYSSSTQGLVIEFTAIKIGGSVIWAVLGYDE